MSRSLRSLATTVRGESPPPAHPLMAEANLALGPDIDQMISEEINMIVDGVETIALLLRSDHDGSTSLGGGAVTTGDRKERPAGLHSDAGLEHG